MKCRSEAQAMTTDIKPLVHLRATVKRYEITIRRTSTYEGAFGIMAGSPEEAASKAKMEAPYFDFSKGNFISVDYKVMEDL